MPEPTDSFLGLLAIAEGRRFMDTDWDDHKVTHTELHDQFVARLDAIKAGRLRIPLAARLTRSELRIHIALVYGVVVDWTRDGQPFLRYLEGIDAAGVAEHYGYTVGSVKRIARTARAKLRVAREHGPDGSVG